MKITISGASDDLIEIGGDFREEFQAYGHDDDGLIVVVGDGSIFDVTYDGEWRITPRVMNPTTTYKHTPSIGPDGDNHPGGESGYSDIVTLEGDLRWVLCVTGDYDFHRIPKDGAR